MPWSLREPRLQFAPFEAPVFANFEGRDLAALGPVVEGRFGDVETSGDFVGDEQFLAQERLVGIVGAHRSAHLPSPGLSLDGDVGFGPGGRARFSFDHQRERLLGCADRLADGNGVHSASGVQLMEDRQGQGELIGEVVPEALLFVDLLDEGGWHLQIPDDDAPLYAEPSDNSTKTIDQHLDAVSERPLATSAGQTQSANAHC